jgi:hypothetical protein
MNPLKMWLSAGRIFGPEREEVARNREDCKIRSFIICVLPKILVG